MILCWNSNISSNLNLFSASECNGSYQAWGLPGNVREAGQNESLVNHVLTWTLCTFHLHNQPPIPRTCRVFARWGSCDSGYLTHPLVTSLTDNLLQWHTIESPNWHTFTHWVNSILNNWDETMHMRVTSLTYHHGKVTHVWALMICQWISNDGPRRGYWGCVMQLTNASIYIQGRREPIRARVRCSKWNFGPPNFLSFVLFVYVTPWPILFFGPPNRPGPGTFVPPSSPSRHPCLHQRFSSVVDWRPLFLQICYCSKICSPCCNNRKTNTGSSIFPRANEMHLRPQRWPMDCHLGTPALHVSS